MNEQELRAIVREAVARHLGAPASPVNARLAATPLRVSLDATHASHVLHTHLVNVGEACVIEPSVNCDHCGYCKSHGH